jgi:hypothetical protein
MRRSLLSLLVTVLIAGLGVRARVSNLSNDRQT